MPSKRQARVLAFIVGYQAEYGQSPSLREIAADLAVACGGTASTNWANQCLTALERKHFIRRRQGVARGIRVLKTEGCK